MKVIYKYSLEITDSQEVLMPKGARLLSVDNQGGQLVVWAIVDPGNEEDAVWFRIFGTGHEHHAHEFEQRPFLGTVQMGAFVWHVFGGFYVDGE